MPRRVRGQTDQPDPIDRHVGARMRQRRTLLGISQEKLAGRLGLTFQQVQKYERGANRVSASRLYRLAQALDVPVGYFFEELPPAAPAAAGLGEAAPEPYEADPLARRETLELVRAYYRIPHAELRKQVFEMTKAMARLPGPGRDRK